MRFVVILTAAVAVNIFGIMFLQWLMDLPWRYRGQNIKARVRAKLDDKWLHCRRTTFCRECNRLDECTSDCVTEVMAEIDSEIANCRNKEGK